MSQEDDILALYRKQLELERRLQFTAEIAFATAAGAMGMAAGFVIERYNGPWWLMSLGVGLVVVAVLTLLRQLYFRL